MSVSNEFMKIVNNKAILDVKIQLKQYALLDESLKTFNDAFEYAKEKLGKELIEKHDGEEFSDNSSEWNEDYAIGIVSDLVFNFSQERVDHLREVFKKVYPNAKPYEESTPSHVSLNGSQNGKVVGEKILSERVIEKGSKPAEGKVKTNPNGDKERESPGSARRTETMGSKFENTAGKAAGAVLMASGAVAAVAGVAVGSTGVAVAGAAALAAGVAVTALSSNKKD